MSAGLITRLRAALDEREAVAQAARRGSDGTWRPDDFPYPECGRIVDDAGEVVTYDEGSPSEEQARHIAAHDPAFVLADIAAKRKLIARGGPFCTSGCDERGGEPMDPDTNWTTPLEHHLDCGAYEAAKIIAEAYGISDA